MGELLLLTFTDESGSKKRLSQVDSAFGIDRFVPTVAGELGLNGGPFALKMGERLLDPFHTFEQAGVRSGTRLILVPKPKETRILVVFQDPKSGRSRAMKVDSTQPLHTDLYSILEQLDIRREEGDPKIPRYSLKLKRTGKWVEGRTLQEAGVIEGDAILVIKHPPSATPFQEALEEYRKGELSRKALDELVGPALQDASADRSKICQVAARLRLTSAAPELVRMLSLPEPKLRNSAIVALARLRHQEAIPKLLALLNDPASAGPAARALASLRAHQAIPSLRELLKSPDAAVRSGALTALSQFEPVPAREFLQDPDSSVRTAALQALARMNDFDSASAAAGLLNDRDAEVRREAAETVGLLGTEEHAAATTPLLLDADPAVRAAAVHALGLLHVPRTAQMAPLLKDPDVRVREAACKAFGMLKAKSALMSLLLRGEPEAILPLAELGVKEAVPYLRRFLNDEEEIIRWRAAHALGKLGSSEGHPVLLGLLRHKDAHLRMLGGMSAGEFRLAEALPELISLLSDDDPEVREGVALEIGGFRAAEAVPPLVALLTDDFAPVRNAAAAALHAMNARQVMPTLTRLLQHDKAEARTAALVLLNRFNDSRSIPDIAPLLDDPEPAVRMAALATLGEMSAATVSSQIVFKLKDPNPDVRAAAADAACRIGAREGVPVLLESRRPLFALNALRRPELWGKLRSTPYTKNMRQSARAIIEELALMLKSEVAKTGRYYEWLAGRVDVCGEGGGLSVLDVIAAALVEGPYEVVLEPDCIRLLLRSRAEEFWKNEFTPSGSGQTPP